MGNSASRLFKMRWRIEPLEEQPFATLTDGVARLN
jgi:hypothetical protein